ncbi:MAG: metal-dependent transcriptional regulator [Fidelibacterota bacterium]|nr:MAG: metal-dependent transcriptional regulator [Candidatus Neomarinimicrobiota bacterium]
MKPCLIDEILEAVWIAHEEGRPDVTDLNVECKHDVGAFDLSSALSEMEALGLLKLVEGRVEFTTEGRAKARNIIRRHRLAQRLLMDVLDVSEGESEDLACRFEHFLSEEVTDKVAAFLGHPQVDPNGRPIPPGETVPEPADFVTPLITRLSRLKVGESGRVAFLTPSFHKRFDRLAAFGINPGAVVNLHQRKPAYVVRLGETELALDPEIADEIYVRPLN